MTIYRCKTTKQLYTIEHVKTPTAAGGEYYEATPMQCGNKIRLSSWKEVETKFVVIMRGN